MLDNGRLADVMGHVVRSCFVISIFLGDQTLVVLAQYIFSDSLTRCSPELSNSCNTKSQEGRMTDLSPSLLYLFQYTLLDHHWLSKTINMVPRGKEIPFKQSRHKQCSSSIDCSGHSITITTLNTSQNFSLKSLQITSHVSSKFHLFPISDQANWITPGILHRELTGLALGYLDREAAAPGTPSWMMEMMMEDGWWIRGRGWWLLWSLSLSLLLIIIIIAMTIVLIITYHHYYSCHEQYYAILFSFLKPSTTSTPTSIKHVARTTTPLRNVQGRNHRAVAADAWRFWWTINHDWSTNGY